MPRNSDRPGECVQATLEDIVRSTETDISAMPDRADDRVHDIRVGMKKFRATLRLASAAIPSGDLRRIDRLAREVKAAFGSQRDRDVQLALLRQLLGKRAGDTAATALSEESGGSSISPFEAGKTCKKLSGMTSVLTLQGLTQQEIMKSLAKSYRDARRAMESCWEDGADDHRFHEWRKRVKQVLYQTTLLCPHAERFIAGLSKLSSALGSQHDLALLCQRVSLCGPEAERLASEKKQKVAKIALELGREIFREKARDLCKSLLDFDELDSHDRRC